MEVKYERKFSVDEKVPSRHFIFDSDLCCIVTHSRQSSHVRKRTCVKSCHFQSTENDFLKATPIKEKDINIGEV